MNNVFEELADLKKMVRMKVRAHGLSPERLRKIQKIISNAKDEIIAVLKS